MEYGLRDGRRDPEARAETQAQNHDHSDQCSFCSTSHPFRMPPAIVEAALEGRVVIFAGAGISTEALTVFPDSFYEEMKSWLKEIPADDSFPAIMSAVESEISRVRLIEEALGRLRYAASFPSLRFQATRFHRELATIPQIREVITTNWDDFFEEICGMTPIVVDGDYSFYNLPGRKVYKIHGSVSSVSTIIVTSADYKRRESELRDSVIGGTLRHLLGTKIVLFMGYSLRDADFRSVYEPLLGGMGQLRPTAYVVGPHDAPEAERLGIRHIKTDAAYFLHELKQHLIDSGHNLPDSILERVVDFRNEVRVCHKLTGLMDWREHPELVFSLAYQDGLLESAGRMISQFYTGEYSCAHRLGMTVSSYRRYLKMAVAKKRYWDAAYINGYMDALMVPLCPDDTWGEFYPYEFFDEEDFPTTAEADADETDLPSGGNEGQSQKIAVDDEEAAVDDEAEDVDDSSGAEESDQGPVLVILDQDNLITTLGNVGQCIPEMMEEGRRIIASVGNLTPQHTAFIDGVYDPLPIPFLA